LDPFTNSVSLAFANESYRKSVRIVCAPADDELLGQKTFCYWIKTVCRRRWVWCAVTQQLLHILLYITRTVARWHHHIYLQRYRQ